MYDNYMFGTVKTYSRKEHNSPGSLSKVLDQSNADKRRTRLCEGRYKEAKAKGHRKPVLRLMKEGRSAVVTAFVRKLDANINKWAERDPKRGTKCAAVISSSRVPEKRIVSNPPTPASALSRVLPVGVPIDVWTPKCYNEELDAREKAMYIDTGVAFPLDKFCNDQDVAKWAKMPAKQFMEKCGNDVLAQYNLPTPEEITALGLDKDCDADDDSDNKSTDLEDTDEDDEMEE
ncbi:hypothetical protein B0H16DRAFT_1853201 [Mycena metata]|uniref:Uncharacterized protein n=1 Tax=Mycena metata TaxID=1033252 RepID=A0AAD7K4L8_9AGAR|nr:hypothetical protein B0H16DRAFT_1853201 [Mycena metata]